ncbi:MAG: hypothetical protein HYU63_03475 [Armatimonadetes bacterium]|nr:hypothetical protein [Armatimonadota bacterium]
MGGVLGSHAGPLGIAGALVEGGLLGTFTMFRGEAKSIVRDSGGGAVMLDGLFMPGVSKVAGGIASAIASKYANSNKNKLILGAISGAILGGVLAASGFVPLGAGLGSIICALSGGLGPFFGPRFSQFFRNLSQDCGKLLVRAADNLKIIKKNLPEKTVNSTGAFPACFLKEGIRTYIYSNGSLGAIIVSALTETIEQIHIFLTSKGSQNKSCIE